MLQNINTKVLAFELIVKQHDKIKYTLEFNKIIYHF